MRLTVTYLGVPVVALDAGVLRTPAGAVAAGLGAQLGGYAAYRAGGGTAAGALELRDAHGALVPTTALRVAPTPFGRRVVVLAYLRDAAAGVPARLAPRRRSGAATNSPASGT